MQMNVSEKRRDYCILLAARWTLFESVLVTRSFYISFIHYIYCGLNFFFSKVCFGIFLRSAPRLAFVGFCLCFFVLKYLFTASLLKSIVFTFDVLFYFACKKKMGRQPLNRINLVNFDHLLYDSNNPQALHTFI